MADKKQGSLLDRMVRIEDRLIRLPGKAISLILVLWYAMKGFRRDLGFERSATLSFATLLSIIPLVVLFFGFTGQLGWGDKIIGFVEEEVFDFMVPEFQEQVASWLRENISRSAFEAGPTGLVNIGALVALIASALGLLSAAERVFNLIWRLKGGRSYLRRLAAFWIVLTTSPFLFAASMTLNRLLVPKGGWLEGVVEDYWIVGALYGSVIPFFVAFLGISMLYLFLPATRVPVRSALVGGFVGALLWSLSKAGFYVYVATATTARDFYGQLATLPLFLVWVFVSWAVIIYGGEVAYCHENLRALRRASGARTLERSRVYVALEILERIHRALRRAEPVPTAPDLANDLGVRPGDVEEVARQLSDAGFLVEDAETPGRFVLGRDAAALDLGEVARTALNAQFEGEHDRDEDAPHPIDVDPTPAGRLIARVWEGAAGSLDGTTLADLTAAAESRDEATARAHPDPEPAPSRKG